jgi:transcriptional repressor of cell division inhibition gene dicB
MHKQDAVSYFGTQQKLANALGITQGTIGGWGELVPMGRALQLEKITNGALKADLSVYVKPTKQASQ